MGGCGKQGLQKSQSVLRTNVSFSREACSGPCISVPTLIPTKMPILFAQYLARANVLVLCWGWASPNQPLSCDYCFSSPTIFQYLGALILMHKPAKIS